MSMREVEPGVKLIMDTATLPEPPAWRIRKTVDSDGDITLVSIRKPGFVGNLNDAPSTIQATMDDVLNNSPSKSRPVYNPENNE